MTFSSFTDDPEYTLTDEELAGYAANQANTDPAAPTPSEVQASEQAEVAARDSAMEEQPSTSTSTEEKPDTGNWVSEGETFLENNPSSQEKPSTDEWISESEAFLESQASGSQQSTNQPEPDFGEEKTVKKDPGSAWVESAAKDAYADLPHNVKAKLALAAGTWDTAADMTNNLVHHVTGGNDYYAKVPKASPHESENYEMVRRIGAFVGPEILMFMATSGIGNVATKVGWLSKSKFLANPHVRRFGNLIAAAGPAAVIGYNSEYSEEPGNLADVFDKDGWIRQKNFLWLNQTMPKQLDWIQDNYGTLHEDDTDAIRQKNINMDVGTALAFPFFMFAGGMTRSAWRAGKAQVNIATTGVDVPNAAARNKAVTDLEFNLANQDATIVEDGLAITGNNPNTEDWLRQASPNQVELNKQTESLWNARYEEGVVTRPWVDLDEAQQASTVKHFYDEGLLIDKVDMGLEEGIARAIRDQDLALDELGRYNISRIDSLDQSVPIKGVNDLFDWNEIGMRTLDDFGVVGAKIDTARIAYNAGSTNGRIRNMISPASLKFAVNNLDSVDDISLGIARNLDEANDFTAKGAGGWKLTNKMMDDAADGLTIQFLDPSLDVNGLRRMLSPVLGKTKDGTEILLPRGNELVKNQIAKLGKEMSDMTIARAQAYVGTSLAGQVSDLAEAARYNRGTVAVAAAQEKIADNMAFLMRLKASSNYYMNNKAGIRNLWKTQKAVVEQTPDQLIANYDTAMKTVNSEIDQSMKDLKWAFKNEPELGNAIMELYEATDGRVFDIKTIQDTANQSLAWARPRFSNIDAETPNLMGQAIRGNWFNSMLSAVGTPARATLGNFGGIIDEPVSYFAGALMRWDMDSMSKGFYAYRSLGDVQRKAFPLMGKLYTKAAQNIDTVERATDLDFVIKQDAKLDGLRRLANNEAAKGNTGYSVMLNQYVTLNEMAMDPVLRFNSNLMTGMDGLPQSMYANSEARFRALEKMASQGDDFNPDEILSIANKEYNSMFDSTGSLLKDQAAKYGADRISLRRNTAMADSLNTFLRKYPAARILFPFPGTQANIISLVDETIPFPLRSWQKDINDLAYTSMKTFSEEPALVRRVLENRGFNVDTMDQAAQLGAITRLKNKTLGRKGVATLLYGGAVFAVSQDRLTGEGLYDKEAQQARELANIPKNSFKMPNGEWVAIDSILGPGYGRWVSTVATAAENFNYLGEQNFSNLEKKFGLIFGAAIKDDSGLSGLEPIFQLLNGESYGINRFAAGQVNSLGPLGGFRNEMGNVLNGGLRIVDNDMQEMMLNRNKALGLVTPKADLPVLTNPLTGEVPNQYNFMQRLWNTTSRIQITPEQTENGQFLADAGMSYNKMFDTKDGVKLTGDEQERLYQIVGEQQILNKDLTKIRKYAESINYIQRLKEYRAAGATDDQLQEFLGINDMWTDALRIAKKDAFLRLEYEFAQPINQRIEERERERVQSQIGDITTFIDEIPTR